MLRLFCKFGESIWNPYGLLMLTSSSDSNYVPNKHGDLDQYDSYAIRLRWCHVKAILKVWWIKMKSLLSYHANALIWHLLCLQRACRCWLIWLICDTTRDNVMLKVSCKFGESKCSPYWVIVLTSSSGTNYVPNEHDDVDQYDRHAIPSEIMSCKSNPLSLVNQNEIPVALSC